MEDKWEASLHTLEGYSSSVSSVVFSLDGKLVASASGDSTVKMWDITSGSLTHALPLDVLI